MDEKKIEQIATEYDDNQRFLYKINEGDQKFKLLPLTIEEFKQYENDPSSYQVTELESEKLVKEYGCINKNFFKAFIDAVVDSWKARDGEIVFI